MNSRKTVTRREFLKLTGLGSAALFSFISLPRSLFSVDSNDKLISKNEPDVEIALRSTLGKVPLLPGKETKVWTYRGNVLRGDPDTLQTLEDTYLGPIFRVKKGQKVRIHYTNEIPESSIIHWHGLHVPDTMDGHPRFAINKNKKYVYEFEVKNRAGTYWYHPHPHGITGPQVYFGLAGLFIVTDDEEKNAGLPSGDYDIPVVIQDRTFDKENRMLYLSNGMMDQMTGFLGNSILVNGRFNRSLRVSRGAYRLRILNGSNSRIYKLGWSSGKEITVIATDGGLLENPIHLPYAVLGPGERIEVWMDFSNLQPGARLSLRSLPFSSVSMEGMMERMHGRRGVTQDIQLIPQGADFTILDIDVSKEQGIRMPLPERLSRIERPSIERAVNYNNPRQFNFFMQRMNWTINGRVFEMERVSEDETVGLNTKEVWEFINGNQGMGMMGMMNMPHPVHVHGLQFRIIERKIQDSAIPGWSTIEKGIIDQGFKDTLLLFPGMRVKALMEFKDYPGLFLYHCHNLEHEDMGMMRNYLVRA